MKKFLAVLTILSLILAACGSNDEKSSDNDDQNSSEEDKTISVAMVAGVESSAVKQMIPEFEEETGINVEWNEFDYNTLYERIYNDLRNGGKTYDVIFADDPWMPMFAGGGFLTPLKELGYTPDEDFVKTSRQVSMWPAPEGPRLPNSDKDEESKYYAVPQVGNVQLFFYRKDILNDIPQTWEDLEKAIEEHQGETKYGFVHRGARGNPVATNFNAFLWSHGADFFDKDWNVTLDNPEAIDALERYLNFKKNAPEGIASYNSDQIGRVMAGGDALSSIVWPVWAQTMEDEEKSEVVGKMGYGLVPKAEGHEHAPMIGNWLFAIPEGSDKKENALSFIEWASSKDVQTEMTKLGGLPTRTSVLKDEELLKDYPYLEAVHEGLQSARWRPRTPLYSEIEQIYGTYLNRAISGEIGAEEALTKAADEISKLMEENGY
ncbi:extracellular solute-binding protein [Salibacterium aidingense]|uniref:extracellular solute-binding protein n=1 Tax=Salibacterium aidingense TaxID=384933 RepID=UPI0003FF579A|nr:extracellular solute-binding protein [Salibacterium aidingense]